MPRAESSAGSTCSSLGPQPESVPALPAKFANPALYDVLKQRCSLPPSLVKDIRSLAADPTLGSALRERERLWETQSLRDSDRGRDIAQPGCASVSTSAVSNEDGVAQQHAPAGVAGTEAAENFLRVSEEEDEGQALSNKRRKLSQIVHTAAAISTPGQTLSEHDSGGRGRPSEGSGPASLLSIGPSPSLQARLSSFDASLPTAFRLSTARSHPFASGRISHGEGAIIQPTETRKIISCSHSLESGHLIRSNRSDDASEPQERLVVRLSVSSMHASGGRRKAVPSSKSDPDTGGQTAVRDGALSPLVNQEVEVLASMSLAALGDAIVCPTRRLPVSLPSNSTDAGGGAELNFIAASGRVYLPPDASDAERRASLRISHGSGIIPSTSETLAKDIGDMRLCDLPDLRAGQDLFLLHCGSCTHLLTVCQICLHTASDPPTSTYPRTISLPHAALRNPMVSMMIKKRFHPNVLSPMLCGICDTWPGQVVLLGGADVRPYSKKRQAPASRGSDEEQETETAPTTTSPLQGVGEEALVCCAGCWRECGGDVEALGTDNGSTADSQRSKKSSAARKAKGKAAETRAKLKISHTEREHEDERWDALPIR
ncbi:unnamed protein product [Tilletia laevis]|uniref:Uncharacterized protein n=2 Tax=Tilletia TaxID=13289 RepID=A0A9N8LTV1_9BASI|nr:hypothetical protein CF335_g3009 [Tilletia laevis]CAD6888633.1 unnamed protein product [Tilletia caries]CAD6901388.1 unnamed protein product [Tilletia caries]CAD6905978.1 unnamed protein product [Tilletia caries]CAD6928482.1 unnamed protein product [Tilletia laevis]